MKRYSVIHDLVFVTSVSLGLIPRFSRLVNSKLKLSNSRFDTGEEKFIGCIGGGPLLEVRHIENFETGEVRLLGVVNIETLLAGLGTRTCVRHMVKFDTGEFDTKSFDCICCWSRRHKLMAGNEKVHLV